MRYRRIVQHGCALAIASLMVACAGRTPSPVSTSQLADATATCEAMGAEIQSNNQRAVLLAQTTVAKYMAKRRRPPSQSWKTFLRNHAEGIAALDLFVVPTVDLRMLFALVVVTIDRRLMVTINVTTHPTAEWIARQITEAFPWDRAPLYLIRDRDGAYGQTFKRRLHAMGIRD